MKLRKTARICRGGGNYLVALASNCDSHDAARAAFPVAAPGRYLYVASGSEDHWAGPEGEKAAAESAAKAWEALGLKGMGGHVGYHCHKGPHDLDVGDIGKFLDFCDPRLANK